MAEAKLMSTKARPLSPHLSIYRMTITMAMSIVHRITGGALYVGTVLLVWWLLAASGAKASAKGQWFMGSIIGQLILFGYTWALVHHMYGGIRHFIWDTGHGMEPGQRELLAWIGLIGSIATTVALWVIGYMVI